MTDAAAARGWRDRPHAPAAGTRLCALAELPEDNGLERRFGEGERAFRVVVFRAGDGARAYVNECPHFHVRLNFREAVFCVYDLGEGRQLMCAHHTAMFRIDDGACVDGPCVGDRLLAVDVAVDAAGDVVVT